MLNQTIPMIYDNYTEEMNKAAVEDARHFGGLSRIITGKGSGSEDLMPAFDCRLQAELNRLFGEQSDSEGVRELAEFMIDQVAVNRDEPRLKYSFIAVQRHLIPLTGCLNSADAAYLYKKFNAVIPRRERFPVQNKLVTKLKEQSQK